MSNYHQLYYHATWSTKERYPMIDTELQKPLHSYLSGKTIDMGGIAFAVGGVMDHVHVCLMIPPQISISTFLGQLKGASAHWINHIAKPGAEFHWQDGYAIFTLSKVGLKRVVAYIENQETHHRDKTYKEGWEILPTGG
jgi:putative transposase